MAIEWDFDPHLFADVITEDVNKLQRAIAITILNNIQVLSPVDEGRYRGNHIVSFGVPDHSYSERTGSMSVAFDAINGMKNNEITKIYIQNNLPYAAVIEFGGYPNPVKKGSWNKFTQSYEIKSINGYSKQAPQGVYGLSFDAAVAIYT